ncbi:hypothetical protein [Leptospira sp. GIMC2001]|uniref:hypothetical protein n=1 Tax=Leptospira sp. GIMC2001 TaxID=1513297 RepID=UPI00234A6A15|nr:hypothetical protein [Leptospira sp. GIMC2001]WCL50092.1 hypothetical protein O4O04_04545 [Leptospira sp. GIMC2001]
MKRFLLILFATLLSPIGIFSDSIPFGVEWKEVKGSKGYLVHWRVLDSLKTEVTDLDPNEINKAIKDKKYFEKSIATNNVQLELDIGFYAIRVASKNAFGKPGKFSEWRRFEIKSNQKNQTLDLSQQADKKLDTNYAYNYWEAMIPGYVQWKQGSKYNATFYGILIPTIAYIGFREKIRGDAIAKDVWNDPFLLGFGLSNQPIEIQTLAWIRRQNEKSKYKMSQNLQTFAVAGLFSLFLIHGLDLYFFGGQGIIQSASWSEDNFNRSPLSELRQGVQFQVRIDL